MPKEADDIIYSISTFILFCFILDIIMHHFADPAYIRSFFFWLDLIATISMLFDIGWLT